MNLQGSVAVGGDNRFVFTGQYFNIWETSDPLLYAGLASGTGKMRRVRDFFTLLTLPIQ